MSLAKNIYYTACSLLPLPVLKQLAPLTLLPYHHTVSDEVLLHVKHMYNYKNVKEFTADLDYLLKHFKPVSPDDLAESVRSRNKLPQNSFLLTFDDGFREVHDIIAPILESKGVPAIFFINPAFIDNKKLFYRSKTSLLIDELLKQNHNNNILKLYGEVLGLHHPTAEKVIYTFRSDKSYTDSALDRIAEKTGYSFEDYLNRHQPFLTTTQLHSLHGRGFTIGAHSWDHPDYSLLSHEEQLKQTVSSCEFVKNTFNVKKKFFSFPFSDTALSQKLFDALTKTDIDLFFGIQNQKDEFTNRMIHRFNAERPEMPLKKQVKGMLAMTAMRKLRNSNKVIR